MELKHHFGLAQCRHNSQRRYYVDGGIYLPAGRQVSVTCKTLNNYPFFRERLFCDFNPLTPLSGGIFVFLFLGGVSP
jgi:hypothetical protein